MDVLENILERIAQTQEQRDVYLKQAEAEDGKIAKLESMYYLLEDPTTQELMQDVVVGHGRAERRRAAQRQQRRGGREALRRDAAGPRVRGRDQGGRAVHGPRRLHD